MEIWLDTIDLTDIREACELNILTGVTTNPSILSKASAAPDVIIQQLLDVQPGLVAAQVIANDLNEMVTQAQRLARLSARIIIKIPVTLTGLRAIAILTKENIPTMATAIFESRQLFLAAIVGAKYAAPYVGRIEETTGQSQEVLLEMMQIILQQKYELKILAAAINSTDQLINCAKLGIHAITLPSLVYKSLLATHPLTDSSLSSFDKDWRSGKYTASNTLFD